MRFLPLLLLLACTTDGADGTPPLDGGIDGSLCAVHCVAGEPCPDEALADVTWPPVGCGYAPCRTALDCSATEGGALVNPLGCESLACAGGWCERQRMPDGLDCGPCESWWDTSGGLHWEQACDRCTDGQRYPDGERECVPTE